MLEPVNGFPTDALGAVQALEPKGYAENGSPTDSLHLISQLRYVVRLT